MKLSALLVIALLPTAACSKKDNKNEAPATGAKPTAADQAAPPAAAPVAAPAAQLDCDKVLPKDLRDKYFKDFKIENGPSGAAFIATCKATPLVDKADGEVHSGEISAHCHDNTKSAKAPTIEGLQKAFKDMKPIAGIPDSLAQVSAAGWQFNAWDTDSNCMVQGIIPTGVDGPAFVKDWLAALPAK